MADHSDDGGGEKSQCLHCYFFAAIDTWARDVGQVDAAGNPEPNMPDVAKGIGELMADVIAMAPDSAAAGLMFRAIIDWTNAAYPAFRASYRESDGQRPARDGIHGMLEAAVLKGKPN